MSKETELIQTIIESENRDIVKYNLHSDVANADWLSTAEKKNKGVNIDNMLKKKSKREK